MENGSFLSGLQKIYPSERLLTRPAQLAAFECDALTTARARPQAVVIPLTQEEVIQTVRLCSRYGVPFVARGSGTSLSGGAMPVAEGILIALNRLNRIVRLNATCGGEGVCRKCRVQITAGASPPNAAEQEVVPHRMAGSERQVG